MNTLESIKLRSIILNNIRRFGEDVEIKFGAGATILIAPNGSGKTAVLEAIELALTSGVKRVSERWAPLIRDGGKQASVQINFGDWQREVSVTKSGVSVINEGKLEQIFNDINPEEIPFLLRLTHLLDQRDSDWFCQQCSEDAGGQLAMLPLGRQASQVSSTVARLRPSVSKRISELNGIIVSRQKILDDWNALIRVRDSAQTDLSRPLIPLSLLIESLEKITDTTTLKGSDSIAAVREQWAIANTINSQNLYSVETTLANLDGLLSTPATYGEISKSLKCLNYELQTLKTTQAELQASRDTLNEGIELSETSYRQLIAKLAQVKLDLEQKRSYEQLLVLLGVQQEKKEDLSRLCEEKKAAFKVAQDAYTAVMKAKDINNVLDSLAKTIAQDRDELVHARQSYANWRALELRKLIEVENLQVNSTKIESLSEELSNVVAKVERANSMHHSAKLVLSAYQDAAGAIHAAISTVAEKLPAGTDTCPLCMETYGERELRCRISAALKAMDPRLDVATSELRVLTEALEIAHREQREKHSEIAITQAERARLNEIITNIDIEIKAARENNLLIGFELLEVNEHFNVLQKAIDDKSRELNAKRSAQEPPVSVDVITQLTTHFNLTKRDLAECEDKVKKVDDEIKSIAATLNEFKQLVVKDVTIEQLEQTQKSFEEEKQLSAITIKEVQAKKSVLSRKLLDIDAEIIRIMQKLELEQGHADVLLAKWISAGLVDVPSNEQLEVVKETFQQNKKKTERVRSKLSDIEMELNRIAEANALVAAQREVDSARGKHSENEHTQILIENLINAQDEHALGCERKSALDEFHKHLTGGIEKIRDKISDVVPCWQAILRRIVQEPRFSGTNLNYYKNRAKNHASIQVSLGDDLVGVADIASQAQMTDLQLSFMLAMATIHQWSPWKALLLDDPTQHHDLVHASSVFDVLRDFIVDHNFQVVLTTHDAQQARFLMRKLSNDGIDAKLWTLEPSLHGMTAKQIGGHL